MDYFFIFLIIACAYLLGSIPTAVWVSRWFYRIDIRQYGSGNAGATNVMRVLGIKAGIPVLLFDAFKGYFAVLLIKFLRSAPYYQGESYYFLQILAGVMAVTGHVFPVFARFKGGKGVATLLGVALAVAFYPALTAIGVFILVLIIFRIVSVSSMTAGLSFPVSCIFVFRCPSVTLSVFSILAALALVVTHRKNINRLLKGEEPRIGQKKSVNQ